MIARLGDDEFAILLPVSGARQAAALAATLVAEIAGSRPECVPEPLTVSVGVVAVANSSQPARLLQDAYRALEEVKRSGGCGHRIWDDQHPRPTRHRRGARRRGPARAPQ